MDSGHYDQDGARPKLPTTIKVLIAGGFGAGKTTMVAAVSEIRPMSTEEHITEASVGIDDMSGVESKTTTTVAMDFGRITISDDLVLYLFGTPGQDRFWFIWDELASGAIGAVVLADTRRLSDCFPSIDFFERRQTPFIVAVNCFDGAASHHPGEIKLALNLEPDVPVMLCDARKRASGKDVLIALMEQAMKRATMTADART